MNYPDITKIKPIKTSACRTSYDVDGLIIGLWIITGGTPAIEFEEDITFSQRFPIKDKKWTNKNWDDKIIRYKHQIGKKLQGPTYDVLPNGLKDIEKFISKNLSDLRLKQERFNKLPIKGNIVSKKIHDKEDCTMVRFECNLAYYRFSPVTASSKCYGGRSEDKIETYAPKEWRDYAKFINPIFDSPKSAFSYHQLTEDEFSEMCRLLEIIRKTMAGA